VTADDFGASRGVNEAILRAHREGVVTHASLMITGEAAAEAVALARANPSLAVGLHLVVVCGRSALPPAAIPELVDAQGRFPRGPVASGLRYRFHGAARAALRREIREQLDRFAKTGLPLSHVDGHLHMHLHPDVLSTLVELAREHPIRAIRLPSEELSLALAFDRRGAARKIAWSWIFGRLRRHGERRLRSAGIGFSERVYGLLQTGAMTEEYWLALLPRIRASAVEIYAHPDAGSPGSGARELEALLSPRVRRAITDAGFQLGGEPAPGALAPSARPVLAMSARAGGGSS